jgi:hypothetical protein
LRFGYAPPARRRGSLAESVYMNFMQRQGWYCQFLEADLKTSLPRKLNLDNPAKIIEMAEPGGGCRTLNLGRCLGTESRLVVAGCG